MKPRHAAIPIAVAACCAGVWALQRTADFGFGDNDSPANVKAEFYWSRLAYSSSMAGTQGFGGYGRRGWFHSWTLVLTLSLMPIFLIPRWPTISRL